MISLKHTKGFTRPLPSILTFGFMFASIACLGAAVETIPMGTAYAAWTGGSIASVAIVGIYWFDESTAPIRLLSIGLVILGILGLRFGL